MINQEIQISSLVKHLLYPIQCYLNGLQISETTKFLADIPSVPIHGMQLLDPLMLPTCLLLFLLQLQGVSRYFDVYFQNIPEYEDDEIPKIYLIVEEHHCDPSKEQQ